MPERQGLLNRDFESPKPREPERSPLDSSSGEAEPGGPRRNSDPFMWSTARKVGVAVVGGAVALAGLAMIVLPGPGVLFVLLGLGIWAAEFVWAKRLLKDLRRRGRRIVANARGKGSASTPS